ncbi:unnamed protein product, partial [Porites evermanni]
PHTSLWCACAWLACRPSFCKTTILANTTNTRLPSLPECLKLVLLDSDDRSMYYKTDDNTGLAKCDSSLQKSWYRFQGGTSDHMPTSYIDKLHCGTHAPGWLSGIHPSVS